MSPQYQHLGVVVNFTGKRYTLEMEREYLAPMEDIMGWFCLHMELEDEFDNLARAINMQALHIYYDRNRSNGWVVENGTREYARLNENQFYWPDIEAHIETVIGTFKRNIFARTFLDSDRAPVLEAFVQNFAPAYAGHLLHHKYTAVVDTIALPDDFSLEAA